MRSWLIVCAVALSAPAKGSVIAPGSPPLFLNGDFVALPTAGQPGVLRIFASGRYSQTQTAKVTLRIPSGLRVLRGSLSRTIHTYGDYPDSLWDVVLMPKHSGTFEITGTMVVDVDGSPARDEMDFTTALHFFPDSIAASPGRAIRYEQVVGGRRYRYGRWHMVPIRRSEQITVDDIDVPAAVLKKTPARCATCDPELVRISADVTLDEHGRMVAIHMLPIEVPSGRVIAPDSSMTNAAKESLHHWKFSPSRARGRSVADELHVGIDVVH
jgi:hypothetical protein